MFDVMTLILILCGTTAANAAAVWLYARSTSVKGPGWWIVGAALVSAGMALVSMRPVVGDVVSVVTANLFVQAGYALTWEGMRRYMGKGFSLTAVLVSLAIIGGVTYGNHFFSHVTVSHSARILINAGGIFFFSVFIANTLLLGKLHHGVVTFIGAAYSVNAVVNVVRLGGPVVAAGDVPFLQAGLPVAVFLKFSILFSLSVILG